MRNFCVFIFAVSFFFMSVRGAHAEKVLDFLQGGWSVNCSSPPHLWRIFLDDKAIGPAPMLENVLDAEYANNEISVTFSDGYSDKFRVVDKNTLKYIAQYGPSGELYKDWSENISIYLNRCEMNREMKNGVPSFYQDGWSVDCSRPKQKWRVYDSNNSYGPGSQKYSISSSFVSGPILKINYTDGSGEVFVNINGNKLRYIYDFDSHGDISRVYTNKNIVLDRCGNSTSPNPGIRYSENGHSTRIISREQEEKVVKCVAEVFISGVAKKIFPKLDEDPNVSGLFDSIVSGVINNKIPTQDDIAQNIVLSHTEHYFAEKGNDLGVLATKGVGLANCALN